MRGDRNRILAEVLLGCLPAIPPGTSVLVVEDGAELGEGLSARGLAVSTWRRRALQGRSASPWPAESELGAKVDLVVVRQPREKALLLMCVAGALSCLRDGGEVWIVGANDEGARSVRRRCADWVDDLTTVETRRHCRVWRGRKASILPACGIELGDWRDEQREEPGGRIWVGFPGVFAGGKLDPGTEALLANLPLIEVGHRVLDFACGPGRIGAGVLEKQPAAELWMTDVDALAIAAAQENVSGVRIFLGDGWGALPAGRFDLVLSNPPLHSGRATDLSGLEELVKGAPERLRPGGELWMVTQRHIPSARVLQATFDDVVVPWEDSRYRLWRART